MPTVTLSNEQVIELVKQLPRDRQEEVFKFLLLQPWESWLKLTENAPDKARQAAVQRGKNWDVMTDLKVNIPKIKNCPNDFHLSHLANAAATSSSLANSPVLA